MNKDLLSRLKNNAQVKTHAPMLDIPYISVDTPLHLPKLFGLAPEATHLGNPRDSRLTEQTYGILTNETTIKFCMAKHMRAGTDNAHVSFQHIEELRQLINIGTSHEITKLEFSWVVLGSLNSVRILVDMHGAELNDLKRLPVYACPLLTEENWTRALYLNDYTDNQDYWQQANAYDKRHHNIEHTLYETIAYLQKGLYTVGICDGVAYTNRGKRQSALRERTRNIEKP